jgi:hypothetical protein
MPPTSPQTMSSPTPHPDQPQGTQSTQFAAKMPITDRAMSALWSPIQPPTPQDPNSPSTITQKTPRDPRPDNPLHSPRASV